MFSGKKGFNNRSLTVSCNFSLMYNRYVEGIMHTEDIRKEGVGGSIWTGKGK